MDSITVEAVRKYLALPVLLWRDGIIMYVYIKKKIFEKSYLEDLLFVDRKGRGMSMGSVFASPQAEDMWRVMGFKLAGLKYLAGTQQPQENCPGETINRIDFYYRTYLPSNGVISKGFLKFFGFF